MTRLRSIAAAIVVVVASLGIFASPAVAHERRTVGPYTFVVGWSVEPAYVNQLNALALKVTETATTKAVEGLDKSLKIDVVFGGASAVKPLTLEALFGQPGTYEAQVVPTKTGDYAFHITGTIGTTPIDQKFESGPGRFDGVEDITPLQFPNAIPSSSDLAAKLDDANTKLTIAIVIAGGALVLSVVSLAMARRR